MDFKQLSWSNKMSTIGMMCFIFFSFTIPISLALENTGFILVLLCALLSGLWWTNRKMLFSHLWSWLLLGLIVLFIVGIFYSASDHAWALKALKKESGLAAILFILPFINRSEHYLKLCLQAFIFGCLIVYIIAVLGNANHLPAWAIFQNPAPYYSFFKIYAALFMAFGAFLVLNLLVQPDTTRAWKIFWLICFLLISYNVLWQSLSRTGYIVYFVLLFLFLIQNTRLSVMFFSGLLTVILLVAAMALSPNLRSGLLEIKQNYHSAEQGQMATSGGIRMEYFKNSVHLWKEKPIFGQGTGGYLAADLKIGGITAEGQVTSAEAAQVTPENTFYRILVEQGSVGIILLVGLFLVQLYYSFFKLTGLRRKLAIGFMLTIILASFSQDLILDESPRLFYIWLTALLYAPVLMTPKKNIN